MVAAPVLEWILGDHRAGEAKAGGASSFLVPSSTSSRLIIAMPFNRPGSVRQPPDGRPEGVPGVGEPVVIRAKDRGHQRRVLVLPSFWPHMIARPKSSLVKLGNVRIDCHSSQAAVSLFGAGVTTLSWVPP
jgi:hypothetical protein